MKKGILITSPKEIAIGGGISFSSLDRRDLRKALTYWDEIAYQRWSHLFEQLKAYL